MKNKIILIILLFSYSFLLSQNVEVPTFNKILNQTDSIKSWIGLEQSIQYIKSIEDDNKLSQNQKIELQLIKCIYLIKSDQDSLSLMQLENVKDIFDETKDSISILHAHYSRAMGLFNFKQSKYAAANKYLKKSKSIYSSILGIDHPFVAYVLSEMAELQRDATNYELADSLYMEAEKIIEISYGKNHPEYADILNDFAILNGYRGKPFESIKLYKESLLVKENTIGTSHVEYPIGLNNLGLAYRETAQYQKAEDSIIEAKEIFEKLKLKETLNYAYCINNLAGLYRDIGQFDNAIQYHTEAKNIVDKTHGKYFHFYASTINNLAEIYRLTGDFQKALALYLETKEIDEKTIGKKHPWYAITLNNIATLYGQMGDFEKSAEYFIPARSIYKETVGTDHPRFGLITHNLASVYYRLEEYENAEPLFLQAMSIYENSIGKNHPEYSTCILSLAKLYYTIQDYEKAEPLILENNLLKKNFLNRSFDFLSESEKRIYHRQSIGPFYSIKEFAISHPSTEVKKEIFNTLIFEKGLHLDASIQTKKYIYSQEDTMSLEIYTKLLNLKKNLKDKYDLPKNKRGDVSELIKEIQTSEKELAKRSTHFRKNQQIQKANYSSLLENIAQDEAYIEYTDFKMHLSEKDSTIYAAAILLPSGTLHFVPLCSKKDLTKKLYTQNGNSNDINKLYEYSSRGLSVKNTKQKSLYDLVWAPFDSLLTKVEKVNISPSGFLNRINISAIAIDHETTIGDKYDIITMMSSRSAMIQRGSNNNLTAYVIGGVDYGSNNTEIQPESRSEINPDQTNSFNKKFDWEFLRWTDTESEYIHKKLNENGFNSVLRKAQHATEEDFKNLQGVNESPKIIHLSTHGFFHPISDDKQDSDIKQPLLRSGLVLSNANSNRNTRVNKSNEEDGILTAYEISDMNLSGTDLVVLSACETALGDIVDNEGVYGLQRAFKMAGVKYIMMSLWQVPDRATSEFMKTFYNNLLYEELSIRDAFNKTQLEMRDRFLDPFNWAGFILVE